MNKHLFFSAHEIQTGLRTNSLKCIHASISRYLSDGECWYSRHRVDYLRTMKIEQLLQFPPVITLSIQRLLIITLLYSANRYRFGSHNAKLQNNTIPLLKYPRKSDNKFLKAQMIRIGTLIYIAKICLIAVINTVNFIVDFYTLFIVLLFWWLNINFSFIFNIVRSWLNIKVISKLPNSEQSYRGKVKTHKYINRQIS
jgi:hypothetical protein